MQQIAGERIGRYKIICLLGEGGMAEVYLGFTRGPANVSKLVVMKQIRSELARDHRFVTMFLDEARIATRLNHPNVIHTYDVLEDAGKYILTMEYLEGQSLFDVLQRIDLQFFPLEEHLWILTQVLAGLDYAHALADYDGSPLGVVHRDVSPSNTFITYDGDVKVLDFGIAKASGAVSVTQKGTFKGKLNYCAPEQIQADGPADARADIFAVGVMLWEALAGKRIEIGEGYAQMAQTRLVGREPKIREIRPDVDPALAKMCDRAMAIKPADRYLTASDFQRDLERYLERSKRPVGRAQVAELVQRHFQRERRSMRERIEGHLFISRQAPGATGDSPSDKNAFKASLPLGRPWPVLASRRPRWTLRQTEPQRLFAITEARAEKASPGPAFQHPKSSPSPEPVPVPVPRSDVSFVPSPRRFVTGRLLILAAVSVGVAAAASGVWTKGPGRVTNLTTSSGTSSPAVTPVTPSTPPRPTPPLTSAPAIAPSPETVHLDISVTPSAAKLTLDDTAADGNRLLAEVRKDRNIHVIRASAPGFAPFSQSVTFTDDILLKVRLMAKSRRPNSPRRAGRNSHPPQIQSESKASPTAGLLREEPAGPDPGPAEESRVTPEDPSRQWSSKQIDETNPYAR